MFLMYLINIILIAYLIIIIDVYLLVKNRDNQLLLVINFIIFFFNYSICIGEYIVHNSEITSDLYFTSYGNIYVHGIYLLFLFDVIRFFMFKNKMQMIKIKQEYSPNSCLFIIIYFLLIYISIFEVNREVSLVYDVKISPLYEYSYLFFLLLFYYSDNSSFQKILTYSLMSVMVGQDIYYGGRATSLQLVLLFLIMKHNNFIRFKYIVFFFPVALFLLTVVEVYRSNYQLDKYILDKAFEDMTSNLFVTNTATLAYYSSMTHIYAWYSTDFYTHISSLMAFISTILFGGRASELFNFDPYLSDVTHFATNFNWNIGGGLIFTWYYFWGGTCGIVLFTYIMFYIMKSVMYSHKDIWRLSFVLIVLAIPRWYVYSPLAFFRGPLLLFPILFIFCSLLDKTMKCRMAYYKREKK